MNCETNLMQGDAGYIGFGVNINDEPIDVKHVKIIEFCIGDLIKQWRSDLTGEVLYDPETYTFRFPLTQEETFNYKGRQMVQIRILTVSNQVEGKTYGYIDVIKSISKEILK